MADIEYRSVGQRLPKDFKFVFSSEPEASLLQLSGPVKTQDELDAIITALGVMREWLPAIEGGKADAA